MPAAGTGSRCFSLARCHSTRRVFGKARPRSTFRRTPEPFRSNPGWNKGVTFFHGMASPSHPAAAHARLREVARRNVSSSRAAVLRGGNAHAPRLQSPRDKPVAGGSHAQWGILPLSSPPGLFPPNGRRFCRVDPVCLAGHQHRVGRKRLVALLLWIPLPSVTPDSRVVLRER